MLIPSTVLEKYVILFTTDSEWIKYYNYFYLYIRIVITVTFFLIQDGITTLKITNIDFKNNQEYKLSLKLTVEDRYTFQNGVDNFKFGLIRIAQCSNYGKIYKNYNTYLDWK